MKKTNFIIIICVLVLVVGTLTTILILRGSIWQKEKISDELRNAQNTFDIRLNDKGSEYYIYRLDDAANNDGATITIPDSVDGIPVTKLIDTSLGFSSYNHIDKIIIGKNITYIGKNPLNADESDIGDDFFSLATSLLSIEVVEENAVFSSINGILYTKDQATLLRYPAGRGISEGQAAHRFVIPNGVKKIYDGAFSLNQTLEMVTFGTMVEEIGAEAFSNCSNLTVVNFNVNIKTIGARAFERCRNLGSVILPIALEVLGSNAFANCTDLTSVSFANQITEIGRNCFSGCSNLVSIFTSSEFVNSLKDILNVNNPTQVSKVKVNNAN